VVLFDDIVVMSVTFDHKPIQYFIVGLCGNILMTLLSCL